MNSFIRNSKQMQNVEVKKKHKKKTWFWHCANNSLEAGGGKKENKARIKNQLSKNKTNGLESGKIQGQILEWDYKTRECLNRKKSHQSRCEQKEHIENNQWQYRGGDGLQTKTKHLANKIEQTCGYTVAYSIRGFLTRRWHNHLQLIAFL